MKYIYQPTQPRVVEQKTDRKATEAYLNRVVKRANRAAGYDTNKKKRVWCYQPFEMYFTTYTRSEARALLKRRLKELELGKLVSSELVEVIDEQQD